MLNSLRSWFAQRAFSLEVLKKPWLLASAGGVLTLLIVGSLWRGQVHYVPLYGAHQHVSTEAVSSALASEHIDFRIDPDNGQVLVSDQLLPRARMVLASKNIQPLIAPGYELLDKDEVLGASQFIQNIRYQRGLEGELARSITSLQGVSEARVHLGIQAESGFVLTNQPPSTASVMVNLAPGVKLSTAQVRAITQLVAGSVPGLTAANVHVVDQTGALLNDASLADQQPLPSELLQSVTQPVTKNLAQLLDSAVGSGNYKVTVMPTFDIRKVDETSEKYAGDPKVLEEQLNTNTSEQAAATGVPGTLSNRPAAETTTEANNRDSKKTERSSNQSQRKYAYDRQVTHTRYPDQQLQRLQVAVALNQNVKAIAAMPAAKLTELQALLANAAGLENERGDKLTLDKFNFVAAATVTLPTIPWWQQPDIQFWAMWLGIGVLALLLLLLVIRPWVATQIARQKAKELSTASTTTSHEHGPSVEGHQFESEAELPPRASGIEDKVAYLQQLAANETDRVAEVIKQWINSNDRNRDNV